MTEQEILEILKTLKHEGTQKPLSEIASVAGISESGGLLKIRFLIEGLHIDDKQPIRMMIEDAFAAQGKDALISIITEKPAPPKPAPPKPVQPMSQVQAFIQEDIIKKFKKIVAVYSTKGGVGKSTIAGMLAKEFVTKGLKVAVVDLDIYGPSIPRILGMKGKLQTQDQKFIPAKIDGIDMMSIGSLIPNVDSPLIWRAPLANGVISQIFHDTLWADEYDVLVLDMPPGTGDIPILVGQSIPLDGLLVVSTPQGVALEDTIKGVSMFKKFNTPILGLVYNMGAVVCGDCDKLIPIFPKNQEFDEFLMTYELGVLADLPLDPKVAEAADRGVLEEITSDGIWKKEFNKITDNVMTKLNINK